MKTVSNSQKTLMVMVLVLAGLFMFQGASLAAGIITVTAINGNITQLNPGDVFDTPGSPDGEIQTFDEGVEATIPRIEERRQPIREGQRIPEPHHSGPSEGSTFIPSETPQ
ncbi:MAG: hypothetical protein ABH891_00090 [Candidatus Omnitrophota bacterium]